MAARLKLLVFLLFCVDSVVSVLQDEKPVFASVTWNNNTRKLEIHDGLVANSVAKGEFSNFVNKTGWSYLTVTTNGDFEDELQAYAAGVVEGYLTQDFIRMHWINTVKGYCDEPLSPYCKRLRDYLQENLSWMNSEIAAGRDQDYWHQVHMFLLQVKGLSDGNVKVIDYPGNVDPVFPDPFGVYMFQVGGDFEDLEEALHKETVSQVFGSGSCSALIKLLPGYTDLYVAQDTWTTYQSMLRILKKYDFSFHTVSTIDPGEVIPGQVMTFSSYPGTLMSGDDYYLISSGLATLETTIGNSNASLWSNIRPTGSVPEGIRTMVANRLASDGPVWSKLFSDFNSGTYNNQWMIVDYKRFKPGTAPTGGLLTVLEQIPGYIASEDQTDLLLQQTYWPSYNIPYYPFIFNMSGCQAGVKKYGDWFSYDKAPRAQIFRRDNGKVKDIDSMMKLMRYNDFPHDPLAHCECSPPYSGENGISARSDLNPANGTYPFGALGHRSHGGVDMKLTNSKMFKDLLFIAVAGPTHDQLPPFQWSQSDFASTVPHLGHPDLFVFDPIYYNGTFTAKYKNNK